jgi:hypothetical protein
LSQDGLTIFSLDDKKYVRLSGNSQLKFEGVLNISWVFGSISCFGYEIKNNTVISDPKKSMGLSIKNGVSELKVPKEFEKFGVQKGDSFFKVDKEIIISAK